MKLLCMTDINGAGMMREALCVRISDRNLLANALGEHHPYGVKSAGNMDQSACEPFEYYKLNHKLVSLENIQHNQILTDVCCEL